MGVIGEIAVNERPAAERTSRTIAVVAGVLAGLALACLAFIIVITQDEDPTDEVPVAAASTTTTVAAATTVMPTTVTTTTTPALPPQTTAASPSTTSATTTSTATAATTVPPVGDVEAGLLCRDLHGLGYDYVAAVAYWSREGRPDRMDADRDGIPCETVYPETEVLAFWGEGPPTTAVVRWSLVDLEAYVGDAWTNAAGWSTEWTCHLDHGIDLIGGAVASCRPVVIGEGEYPVLTALVLNDGGTIAVTEAGLRYLDLNPGVLVDEYGSGMFCRDVLDVDTGLPRWIGDPDLQYFGAVLYWFIEDRPDRMDADRNGIPCETLVTADVVDAVWKGGWIGGP
jgi:hypothetical protein